MSKRFYIFTIIVLAASPFLLAHAQVTSSTTIIVPTGWTDDMFQVVGNLFALNSIGGVVAVFVGVILALVALEFLISALLHHR